MQENYYEDYLYPLQDKVLQQLAALDDPFYLTGGTALSRAYLNHRYSDDLDFFVNDDPSFKKYILEIEECLYSIFGHHLNVLTRQDSFVRMLVKEDSTLLKLEFVNDVRFRVGQPIEAPLFRKTDTVENILSNKISALSRNASKDLADLIEISLNYSFDWREAVQHAKNKDLWVDETEVVKMIENADLQKMTEVNWKKNIDLEIMNRQRQQIIHDLFLGRPNSLHQKA